MENKNYKYDNIKYYHHKYLYDIHDLSLRRLSDSPVKKEVPLRPKNLLFTALLEYRFIGFLSLKNK